jgi:hypothetical protein
LLAVSGGAFLLRAGAWGEENRECISEAGVSKSAGIGKDQAETVAGEAQ